MCLDICKCLCLRVCTERYIARINVPITQPLGRDLIPLIVHDYIDLMSSLKVADLKADIIQLLH